MQWRNLVRLELANDVLINLFENRQILQPELTDIIPELGGELGWMQQDPAL